MAGDDRPVHLGGRGQVDETERPGHAPATRVGNYHYYCHTSRHTLVYMYCMYTLVAYYSAALIYCMCGVYICIYVDIWVKVLSIAPAESSASYNR